MSDDAADKDSVLLMSFTWIDAAGKVEVEYVKSVKGEDPALPDHIASDVKTSFSVDVSTTKSDAVIEFFGSSDPQAKVGWSIHPSGALLVHFNDTVFKAYATGTWRALTSSSTIG